MNARKTSISTLAAVCIVALAAWVAHAEPNRVTLPDSLDRLVHYTTVRRGEVTEHMLTTPEAIEAVRRGEPMPDGTHVILVDYRDGEVHRYFVMQKGPDWGADYAEDSRTENWQFQWFWGDRSINLEEDTQRCRTCHSSRADRGFLYTWRDLKAFADTGERQ